VQLLLLRHAHVDGHRGDVAITDTGHKQAYRAGQWIRDNGHDVAAVLYGGTRRTRETAEAVVAGLVEPEARRPEVADSFALRNPDLYLGGERVSMVSTAEAFAEQTVHLTAADVDAAPFFKEWLHHPERVGFWVAHKTPPGDDAASVQRRIAAFATSLYDVPAWRARSIVAITHSPVLRSVGLGLRGTDGGEPPYVNGYAFTVTADSLLIDEVAPATS
jgi:broad specificity phosphatase PhoE